jgi:hypothetical protein
MTKNEAAREKKTIKQNAYAAPKTLRSLSTRWQELRATAPIPPHQRP